MPRRDDGHKPASAVTNERGRFDEVAERVIEFTSRGRFLLIVSVALIAWLFMAWRADFESRWIEGIAAAIAWVTLLLVFAIENANRRRDQAIQRKLNAIADALAEFMQEHEIADEHVSELRAAVGLEKRESTD